MTETVPVKADRATAARTASARALAAAVTPAVLAPGAMPVAASTVIRTVQVRSTDFSFALEKTAKSAASSATRAEVSAEISGGRPAHAAFLAVFLEARAGLPRASLEPLAGR